MGSIPPAHPSLQLTVRIHKPAFSRHAHATRGASVLTSSSSTAAIPSGHCALSRQLHRHDTRISYNPENKNIFLAILILPRHLGIEFVSSTSSTPEREKIPVGWPICAASLYRRMRRPVLITSAITFVVIPGVYLLFILLVPNVDLRGPMSLVDIANVTGGIAFLLFLIVSFSCWSAYRKTVRQIQSFVDGDYLVHWTYSRSDLEPILNSKIPLPDQLESYVGLHLAYFAGGIIEWYPPPAYLVSVELTEYQGITIISFVKKMKFVASSIPPVTSTFVVPVPSGKEEQAKEVVNKLKTLISST